jgi:hypothetical protein
MHEVVACVDVVKAFTSSECPHRMPCFMGVRCVIHRRCCMEELVSTALTFLFCAVLQYPFDMSDKGYFQRIIKGIPVDPPRDVRALLGVGVPAHGLMPFLLHVWHMFLYI